MHCFTLAVGTPDPNKNSVILSPTPIGPVVLPNNGNTTACIITTGACLAPVALEVVLVGNKFGDTASQLRFCANKDGVGERCFYLSIWGADQNRLSVTFNTSHTP